MTDIKSKKQDALSNFKKYSNPYAEAPYLKDPSQKLHRKVFDSLEESIKRSGLKDGMTISFHHAFREGDKTILQVVEMIAKMGFKNLTIASSSLLNCHDKLVDYIKSGVITKIFTSGVRGELGKAISNGILDNPIHIHSHGGRMNLIQAGILNIDVAFLGVSICDEFGNANGNHGKLNCGSLGYAKVDAEYAKFVILLTEEIVEFPCSPASITQGQVDAIVKLDQIGDPSKINLGAARESRDPRDLLIARNTSLVIQKCGYFKDGFSFQTGTGGASTATTRYLEQAMKDQGITASFALGGITSTIADLHKQGLIKKLADVQSFDIDAANSLRDSSNHIEISANEYANITSKAAYVDRVDVVVLSALEIDIDFNVNVLCGSDGILLGASGGHSDVAAGANVTIVVAPLLRTRISSIVETVTTKITPGECVDILVTDHGIAVNPLRPELEKRLKEAKLPIRKIKDLYDEAIALTGRPEPLKFTDKTVAIVHYRDGSVIDTVKQLSV